MSTLDQLSPQDQAEFDAAMASSLTALELERRAAAAPGPRRPSIAELWAYAEDRGSIDAPAIRAAIGRDGHTARNWRSILDTRGALVLDFVAAASDELEALAATDVGGGARLDLKRSEFEKDVFILIVDLSGAAERLADYLSIDAPDGSNYLEIKLVPAYRGIIQMDIDREQAAQIFEARRSPMNYQFRIW